MKEVIFVRHAKSDWGGEGLRDIDRPLSDRGYNDAYFMSKWYSEKYNVPDLMVSSPATRALSTGLIFLRALGNDISIFMLDENIYEANVSDLINVLNTLDPSVKSVMLFGHNPSFTTICNDCSPDFFFENIPTCGIVAFRFEIESWKELSPGLAKLNYYNFPKDFKNKD